MRWFFYFHLNTHYSKKISQQRDLLRIITDSEISAFIRYLSHFQTCKFAM